jgi:hypothetical protein
VSPVLPAQPQNRTGQHRDKAAGSNQLRASRMTRPIPASPIIAPTLLALARSLLSPSWAGFTINIAGCSFRHAQGVYANRILAGSGYATDEH